MSNNMTNTAKDFPDGSRVQIRRSELENWIGRQSRSPEIWRTRLGTIQGRGNGDSCYVVWDGNNTKQAVWPGWLEIAHNDLPDCPGCTEPRTRCSVSFEHPPHDFCDGNPGAKFGQPPRPPAPAMRVEKTGDPTVDRILGALSLLPREQVQRIADALAEKWGLVVRGENAAMAAERAKGKDTGETR